MDRLHYKRVVLILVTTFTLCSCGNKDAEIKADLTAKAKESLEYAGVTFTVENGVVTLNGSCPTPEMRMRLNDQIKKLYGVKDLVNNIIIAPVIIGTDRQLKLSVDSVLKQYPAVAAIVADSCVTLRGKVEGSKAAKLLAEVQSLRPRSLDNMLTLK